MAFSRSPAEVGSGSVTDRPGSVSPQVVDSVKAEQGAGAYKVFGLYRFSLALLVVVSHTWEFAYEAPERHFLSSIGIGNIGVMAFFILSGFIISEAIDRFCWGRPYSFLGNRFLRLIPPLWAAIGLSVLVHAALISHGARALPAAYFHADMLSIETILVNLTELIPILNVNNVIGLKAYYHFVSYAWAVFIEVMFYLSVFAICLLTGRRFIDRYASAGVLLYCMGGGILLAHLCHEYVHTLYRPLSFVPYFLLGVLLYRLRKGAGAVEWTGVVVVVPLMLVHFSRYMQGEVPLDHAWVENLMTARELTALALLVMAAGLIYPLSYADAGRRLKNADRWFGDLSYPLYLNHYAIVVGFATLLDAKGARYQLSAILLSLALAYGMNVVVEVPLRRIRNSIRGVAL